MQKKRNAWGNLYHRFFCFVCSFSVLSEMIWLMYKSISKCTQCILLWLELHYTIIIDYFFNFHKVFSVSLVYLFENTFPWILKYSNCFASKQKWNWWPFSCCVCLWISKYILTSRKELKYIDDSLCGLQKCKHKTWGGSWKNSTLAPIGSSTLCIGTYVPGI